MDKTATDPDHVLIVQYLAGDTLALQKLVKRWHKIFCEKAYWLTKNAEASKDIAQESWNAIITKMDALNDPRSFKSWALRIVFNNAMDWMRSNRRNLDKLKSYHQNLDRTAAPTNDDEVVKNALRTAIKTLSVEQQMVIRLFYVEAHSLKDISEVLRISVGTVKSRLFHAREKLKEQLKKTHSNQY